jgi:transcriptional regulator with XRE-family HTH domain
MLKLRLTKEAQTKRARKLRKLRYSAVRKLTGLSQVDFSKKAGISFPTVSTVENLKRPTAPTIRSIERLIKASKQLGVEATVAWVVTGRGTPPYNKKLQADGE